MNKYTDELEEKMYNACKEYIEHFDNLKVSKKTPIDKEYEIVSFFICDGGLLTLRPNGKYYWRETIPQNESAYFSLEFNLASKNAKIEEIKRLSDNQSFSIDEVVEDEMGRTMKPIKKFFEKEGVMYAQFNEGHGSNDGCLGLNSLQKATPKPVLLFTTVDGKQIHEGETFWYLSGHFEYLEEHKEAKSKSVPFGKAFSTQEAAQEYVLMNKPCLSVMDILSFGGSTSLAGEYAEVNTHKLKILAKQKI